VDGRLPSEVLGLHLEQDGRELRLYDPVRASWLLKRSEKSDAANRRAQVERERPDAEASARQQLAAENERLRQELDAFRRRS